MGEPDFVLIVFLFIIKSVGNCDYFSVFPDDAGMISFGVTENL